MAFVGRRSLRPLVLSLPALFLAPALLGQAPVPLETIPDPARVAPAEVPFVNPLWQELEAPAAPKGPPPRLEDLEASGALVIGVRIDETGKVSEAVVSGRLSDFLRAIAGIGDDLKFVTGPGGGFGCPTLFVPRWKST